MNTSAGLTVETGEVDETDGDSDTRAELIIAIDGPSGAGKSSASRGVARALGLHYLDTGAMYRALTWWLLKHGIDTDDPEVIAKYAGEPQIQIGTNPMTPWTRVDGADVSAAIRIHEVTAAVSAVAQVPEVRAHLIAMQRDIIARSGGIVAEGRDIGTVVAPGAAVKVFLTAESTARAHRRAEQASWSPDTTRTEQDRRDSMDAAQSGKADDAVEIDSTSLSLDEVVAMIVRLAERIPSPRRDG